MKRVILFVIAAAIAAAGQGTTFYRALTNATAPASSSPVPNNGQAMHLLTAIFPTATGAVTDFVARLEARYDNSDTWFPISADLTSAIHVPAAAGAPEFAYAMTRANGVFPAVRVRLVTASALPVTLYYTGAPYPVGQVLSQGDRYIAQPPGGGGGATANWTVCPGINCAVAADIATPWIAVRALSFQKCFAAAKTGPVGAPLTFDIRKNGTSVFGAGPKLTIAAGATSGSIRVSGVTLAEGDILALDITSVGSTTPGRNVSVFCSLQ